MRGTQQLRRAFRLPALDDVSSAAVFSAGRALARLVHATYPDCSRVASILRCGSFEAEAPGVCVSICMRIYEE